MQVSGKVWKAEAEKRATADKNAILGSSWEKKMQEKALRKAFLEQKQAARESLRDKRKVGGNTAGHQLVWASLPGTLVCLAPMDAWSQQQSNGLR